MHVFLDSAADMIEFEKTLADSYKSGSVALISNILPRIKSRASIPTLGILEAMHAGTILKCPDDVLAQILDPCLGGPAGYMPYVYWQLHVMNAGNGIIGRFRHEFKKAIRDYYGGKHPYVHNRCSAVEDIDRHIAKELAAGCLNLGPAVDLEFLQNAGHSIFLHQLISDEFFSALPPEMKLGMFQGMASYMTSDIAKVNFIRVAFRSPDVSGTEKTMLLNMLNMSSFRRFIRAGADQQLRQLICENDNFPAFLFQTAVSGYDCPSPVMLILYMLFEVPTGFTSGTSSIRTKSIQ